MNKRANCCARRSCHMAASSNTDLDLLTSHVCGMIDEQSSCHTLAHVRWRAIVVVTTLMCCHRRHINLCVCICFYLSVQVDSRGLRLSEGWRSEVKVTVNSQNTFLGLFPVADEYTCGDLMYLWDCLEINDVSCNKRTFMPTAMWHADVKIYQALAWPTTLTNVFVFSWDFLTLRKI